MKNNNVCVIIVTYNGMKWLPRTLKLIPKENNIVVIDNNSQDKTVDYISSNFRDIVLLRQKENLGFGKANNIGLKYAIENNFKYVFLLNQDVYIKHDTISKLVRIYENNKSYGILSPMELNGDGSDFDENFKNYLKRSEIFEIPTEEVFEIDFINASGWFLSSKIIHEVGGFDPEFIHYGEDDDYVRRVVFKGYKVGVTPHTEYFHDRIISKDISKKKIKWYIYKNRLLFYKRNKSLIGLSIITLKSFIKSVYRLDFYTAINGINTFIIIYRNKKEIDNNINLEMIGKNLLYIK